jgi:hypothetical protein
MSDMRRFRRSAASEYIRETWGISYKATTLASLLPSGAAHASSILADGLCTVETNSIDGCPSGCRDSSPRLATVGRGQRIGHIRERSGQGGKHGCAGDIFRVSKYFG